MNSISVGQAVAEFSKKVGLEIPINPMEFSNSTIAEIIKFLENQSKKEYKEVSKNIFGINSWIQTFNIDLKEYELNEVDYKDLGDKSEWVLFNNNNELADPIFEEIKNQKKIGVLICLNKNPEDISNIELLVKASKYCLEKQVEKIVLLQHDGFAQSFIKSVNEELNASLILIDTPYKKEFIKEIIKECKSNNKIVDCIYDENKKRFERFLKILNFEKNTYLESLKNKTILATGGGKGITFECILSLCKKYKNKLIILGRSDPENDEVLKNNLLRLKNSDIDFNYISVDISDKESLKNVLSQKIEDVYCIVHGAGVNNPYLINSLNPDAIKETLNPKILGIKNLLEIFKKTEILINFSSVIGVTGMEGEAHYAYANSWLDWMADKLRKKIRSISINWSVWSGIGMGEKLGKINELINKEITPINPEKGVDCFLNLISSDINKNVVVGGRLGPISPIKIWPPFDINPKRFTESIKIFYPNIEIIAETKLTLNEDIYLLDHCYKGEFVFPVAMGIEAITQTVQSLVGKNEVPSLIDLKLNRPVLVDQEGTTIRIIALKEKEKIKVVLRSSQSDFKIDHFSCFAKFENNGCKIENKHVHILEKESFYLDDNFYGQLFFQSGVFRCVDSYYELNAYSCLSVLKTKKSNYFSEYLSKEMVAGDPGIRDSSIHCLQACLPNKIVLPLKIESWKRFEVDKSEKYYVFANQIWEKEDEYCFDLEVFNDKKQILESWKGLVLKELEDKNWDCINLNLLSPYINRESKKELNIFDFNIFITNKDDKQIMIENCLGDKSKHTYRSDGKPVLDEGFISFSGSGRLNMVIGSKSIQVGCDIEKINSDPKSWKILLGENYKLANLISDEKNESIDISCTRVWSALECVKKSNFIGEDLILDKINKNSLIISSFNFLIYSTIINIKDEGIYCISTLVEKKFDQMTSPTKGLVGEI